MDLGCIDMGCVEKPKKDASREKENSPKESVMSGSKPGKNSKAKDGVRSSLSALNKLTSQISKPPHRKTSPLNWFPRKKVEPYLKRKIKMLQEVDGMHSTLDETLGDSNLHYSRVLREKIAIREAAEKAMEARKAAMVEASWCRILQAARIESKEAEAELSKAEASAAEAFEAARVVGVIMNEQDSSQKHYKIETTSAKGGSTTHTISATFETAFEVDKQVARAVKAAFIKLANCPSISKDEFKELLRKISENPDTDETYNDLSSLECEADAGSAVEGGLDRDSVGCPGETKKGQESDKFSMGNIVDMMLGRLRCLKEDELASLATIVATSGLSAALSEMENSKQHVSSSANPCKVRRTSVSGRNVRNSIIHAQTRGTTDGELPGLDKFLVKHLTRLEKEVLEAKNARKHDISERKLDITDDVKVKEGTVIPDLGSVLVKHSSKLEKEVEEARMNRKSSQIDNKKVQRSHNQEATEVPSLDKFLVKRLTRLEREVQEAQDRKATNSDEIPFSSNGFSSQDKENTDLNKIKKQEATRSKDGTDYESLDKVLVKHVSRLEKEKLEYHADERIVRKLNRKDNYREAEKSEGSLDQVLVKHKSRLEREKMAAAAEERNDSTYSVSRRQAREKELQETWGGLSLGNSIRPHVSRLQRDKAAWLKAEEEERKRTVEGEEV